MQFNPPPSPSTPPALALPSAPSSPLSLATAGTPTSSSSLGSLLQLPSSQAAGAEEEGNPVDSAAKQWEATVDDETLRITLRTAKYNQYAHTARPRRLSQALHSLYELVACLAPTADLARAPRRQQSGRCLLQARGR